MENLLMPIKELQSTNAFMEVCRQYGESYERLAELNAKQAEQLEEATHIQEDLIKQNAALDGELEQAITERDNALKALKAAHETILQKQSRIEELESKPQLTPEQQEYNDNCQRFLSAIEWIAIGWEAAINQRTSTVTAGLKELDSLYRKLWPVGSKLEREGDTCERDQVQSVAS